MKKVIRLTESDLVRIVKRVLTESDVSTECNKELGGVYELLAFELHNKNTAVKYKRPDISVVLDFKRAYNGDQPVICSRRFKDWRYNVLNDHYKSNPELLKCMEMKVDELCKSRNLERI